MAIGLVYALVAGVAVIAVGIPVAVRVSSGGGPPISRWARGAYGLLTGGEDFGELGEQEAISLLETPWGAHNARGLAERMSALEDGESGNEAWDLVRVVILARLGFAAGYLNHAESWTTVTRVALRLQRSYTTWPELAAAYADARSAWLHARGIEEKSSHNLVHRNIEVLAARVWPKIEFGAPLQKGRA